MQILAFGFGMCLAALFAVAVESITKPRKPVEPVEPWDDFKRREARWN